MVEGPGYLLTRTVCASLTWICSHLWAELGTPLGGRELSSVTLPQQHLSRRGQPSDSDCTYLPQGWE